MKGREGKSCGLSWWVQEELPALCAQQGGLIYSPACSYDFIITTKVVLRHSSPVPPHHLLAFANCASDLQSHKQDENQSPQFPDSLELTKGEKRRGQLPKMAWVYLCLLSEASVLELSC